MLPCRMLNILTSLKILNVFINIQLQLLKLVPLLKSVIVCSACFRFVQNYRHFRLTPLIENTWWVSFDITFTRQGFENACWHREACQTIQHVFPKLSLVNLISKDMNLVFYLSVYPLFHSLNQRYWRNFRFLCSKSAMSPWPDKGICFEIDNFYQATCNNAVNNIRSNW